MQDNRRTAALDDIARQGIPDNLDLWPAVAARIEETNPAFTPKPRASRRVWSRRTMIGGAVAAAVAVAAGAAFPLVSRPESVSAQEILDRAQATATNAPTAITTYHLVLNRRVPAKQSATTTTEMWYGGQDHQRSVVETKDDQGDLLARQDVIFNGDQTWIATTEKGQTRVIHTTGSTWTSAVALVPAPGASITDVLRQYASKKECAGAALRGQSSVAGRPTYVIDIQFRPNGCPTASASPAPNNPKAALGGKPAADQNNQVDRMTVWVDAQTYLPLKTEVRNPANALLDESEVTSLAYNVAIPDSTFSYTPPAGAIVSNFTGGTGADVKQSLSGAPPAKPSTAKSQ